jgi:hypothetical protein
MYHLSRVSAVEYIETFVFLNGISNNIITGIIAEDIYECTGIYTGIITGNIYGDLLKNIRRISGEYLKDIRA